MNVNPESISSSNVLPKNKIIRRKKAAQDVIVVVAAQTGDSNSNSPQPQLQSSQEKEKEKEKEDCPVCCSAYNAMQHLKIVCNICNYSACRSCHQTYILGCSVTANCMKCHVVWDREFLMDAGFTRTFITRDYREHQERILFERQLALLPATQPFVELEMRRGKCNDRLAVLGWATSQIDMYRNLLYRQINQINSFIYNYSSVAVITDDDLRNIVNPIFHFDPSQMSVPGVDISLDAYKNRATLKEEHDAQMRRVGGGDGAAGSSSSGGGNAGRFLRHCMNPGCNGFLNQQWKCGICECHICSKCLAVKENGGSGGSIDPHVCDENDVATAKLLHSDSKPCPKCGEGIFKIDGCNQMWCVACRTGFDWVTGKIEIRVHNPEYFRWLAEHGGNAAGAAGGANADGTDDAANDADEHAPATGNCGRGNIFTNSTTLLQTMIAFFRKVNQSGRTSDGAGNGGCVCGCTSSLLEYQEHEKNNAAERHRYYVNHGYHYNNDYQLFDNSTSYPLISTRCAYRRVQMVLCRIIRNVLHLIEVDIPRYEVSAEVEADNKLLRMRYLRGDINRESLAARVQRNDKKQQKRSRVHGILTMVPEIIYDIVRRAFHAMVQNLGCGKNMEFGFGDNNQRGVYNTASNPICKCVPMHIIAELDALRAFTNDSLKKVSEAFQAKPVLFTNVFALEQEVYVCSAEDAVAVTTQSKNVVSSGMPLMHLTS